MLEYGAERVKGVLVRGVWRLGRAAMTIISAKLKGVRLSNRITRRI